MLDPPSNDEPRMAPIRFMGSPAHTLGVEVEVSLIDPETRTLAPVAPQLLERLGADWAKPELFQTIIEINTDVCNTVADVRADLQGRLTKLHRICESLGLGAVVAKDANHGDIQFCVWFGCESRNVVTRVEYEFDSLLVESLNRLLYHGEVVVGVGDDADYH